MLGKASGSLSSKFRSARIRQYLNVYPFRSVSPNVVLRVVSSGAPRPEETVVVSGILVAYVPGGRTKGADVDRRIPMARGVLAPLGVLLVFALALGALVGCSGSEDKTEQGGNEPAREPVEETTAAERAAENVVVRVSGTPGTAYSGTYGTTREVRTVSPDTLGDEPTEYEVGVENEEGVLNATFKKTQPGRDTLEVEILVDGEVVTRSETSAELGSVTVSWVPPGVALENTTLPQEFEK
jgi:hypothetical protein